MKNQKGFVALYLIGILICLALAVGWVVNIVKLIHMVGGDITTMFILRIVGIFAAPFGGVLGWF